MVFETGSVHAATLGEGLNPDWSERAAAFAQAESGNLNFIRLDIGGGGIDIQLDGNAVGLAGELAGVGGINANSILFVDRELLPEALLVTRTIESDLNENRVTAADLGVSEEVFQLLSTVHAQSNWVDTETPIDVNGALYIPMTPIDIGEFDPETQNLVLELTWDINEYLAVVAGQLVSRVPLGQTPYGFELTLRVEDRL